MSFYKRTGVGRYTIEEQAMVEAIERLIAEKGIDPATIPECNTIDDLIGVKQLLESYTGSETENEFQDAGEQQPAASEPETFEDVEELNESEVPGEIDEGIPAGDELGESHFISDDYNPFEEPIIERSYNTAQGITEQAPEDPDEEQLILEDSKKTPLSDLPPNTKRKAAEQTAATLLKGYAQIVPQPFKWLAKLPEQKIEKLAFNGELDLSIEVQEGVTFDDYMKQTNAQIDEIFEVDDETLSDIREPLIEVLMEQDLQLTPTQRLVAAIISHLSQMLMIALKLRSQNNRILSYQKHLTYLSKGGQVAAA
jgi:hypothetical protein